jgi:NB-ARC domain
VQQVVNLTRPWLAKTSVLLLDNIWSRKGSRSWAGELCPLVSNADSSVLLTTRDERIAEHADPRKRFSLGLLKDERSARGVFELRAGLEPGACLPRGVLNSKSIADDVSKYSNALRDILHICNGWQFPLAMCGKIVKESGFMWREVNEKLRAILLSVDVSGGATDHAGLRSVHQTSLEMACSLTSTDPHLLATFGSQSASKDFCVKPILLIST